MTAYAAPPADPTSVVGRRILAYIIDGVLMAVVMFALLVPMVRSEFVKVSEKDPRCRSNILGDADYDGSTTRFGQQSSDDLCVRWNDQVYLLDGGTARLSGRFYPISFGLQALNLVVLQTLTGASLGKLLVGLRVVRADGQKAGFGWMTLRWVLLFVDSICCFLPGAVLVFSTKGHRRLGDMAASTYVIRRRDVGTPIHVADQGVAATAWNPQQAQGWAPTTVAPAPSADGPTWDDARNTYIQYDRSQGQWVQWDAAASAWRPIDQAT